jgi:HEAT repeat protein
MLRNELSRLIDAFMKATRSEERLAIIGLIARVADRRAIGVLSAFSSAETQLAAAAARALGPIQSVRSEKAIIGFLESSDVHGRISIAEDADETGPSPERADQRPRPRRSSA